MDAESSILQIRLETELIPVMGILGRWYWRQDYVRGVATLWAMLKFSEPRRCIVSLEGLCEQKATRGHFLQHALVKRIADKDDYVMQFYHGKMERFASSMALDLPSRVKSRPSARYQFSCRIHEEFFQEMENPQPDYDNPRHLALLAYRSTLVSLYTKLWLARAFDGMAARVESVGHRMFSEMQASHFRDGLAFEDPLRMALAAALAADDFEAIDHRVVYIRREPTIAATGVLAHPLRGSRFVDGERRRIIPMQSSPIALTILPDTGVQVLVLSYERTAVLDVHDLMEHLEHYSGTIGTARLSKKILEETEFLVVSPDTWKSFGPVKQSEIKDYYLDSVGTAEHEFTIAADRVDLFRPAA